MKLKLMSKANQISSIIVYVLLRTGDGLKNDNLKFALIKQLFKE